MSRIDFSAFENTLNSFKQAMNQPPTTELERDGTIQRFEYTIELAWKIAGKL